MAGTSDREKSHAVPWWTNDCRRLHRAHVQNKVAPGEAPTEATKEFLSTVRRAKKLYWQDRIDNCKDDRDLYKRVGWHKLSYEQTDAPLVVEGQSITDPLKKAEALRRLILNRFSTEDDLLHPPDESPSDAQQLPWDQYISLEEADRIIVRLLSTCWDHVNDFVRAIYQKCLDLSYYPTAWKTAEVAMIPKVGKKDRFSPRSMRPIALLLCLGKRLERVVARQMAWASIKSGILSPQYLGALLKRSAMDLVTSFVHNVKQCWVTGKKVTMCTMDVQGAFSALLKNYLLYRMKTQG